MRARYLALALATASVAVGLAAPDTITVEGGRIRGTVRGGVRTFLGIPYAAPPVGARRWAPPQPVVPWSDVRFTQDWGAECPQTQYEDGSIYIRPLRPQSEDCLFLNVWTTAPSAAERRPVLVWIHGGALTRGSGYSDVRNGAPLARQGIVVVSVNYRLGVLGYLAHPELTAESSRHVSGNYGVLDQIAALQWVRRNIRQFGGDPDAVTIAGESAGAWSVNAVVASPLARGLFVRAIAESGGRLAHTPFLTQTRNGLTAAEDVGVAFARTAGAASLGALRAMPAEKLVTIEPFRTMENVDGEALPDEIATLFEQGRQNRVPVIVGSNADEMTPFVRGASIPATLADYRARLAQQLGPLQTAFESAYGLASDADVRRVMLAAARDTTFTWHMRRWARLTVSSGSRAYLYLFSRVPPGPKRAELGAFHAGEMPYVFHTLGFSPDPRTEGFEYTDVDRKLADAMSGYWVNFVKTGNPNGGGLPAWTPYDTENEPYLEFGDTVRAGQHLLKAPLDVIEQTMNRPAPSASIVRPPRSIGLAVREPRPATSAVRTAVPPATVR